MTVSPNFDVLFGKSPKGGDSFPIQKFHCRFFVFKTVYFQSEILEKKKSKKGGKVWMSKVDRIVTCFFLAALAALYLTLVSGWVTATLEF